MGSVNVQNVCFVLSFLNSSVVILLHNLSPNPSGLYACSPMSFLWVVFVLLHFLAQALTEVRMGIGFTVIFLWDSVRLVLKKHLRFDNECCRQHF